MNRYAKYGQLDDNPRVTGDAGFMALDMLTDPAMLPAGTLSVCENFRFDNNGTTVRAGMSRLFPAGNSIATIVGTAVFKPAADADYLALLTSNSLVLFNLADQSFTFATFPAGETIQEGDPVDVAQGGVGEGTLPQLYIARGTAKPVLKYDGNVGSIDYAPSINEDNVQGSGFPPCNFMVFYQDRFAAATAQDVEVSDFDDFTNFVLLNQFQITKGGDDYLQCFQVYQGDYVCIGTREGWYIAFFDPNVGTGGYSGGLTDNSFIRLLTQEAGPVGPRASIQAMGLVWFIAGGAIYAFQPQLDNQLVVLGKPLSAPIQPIMDRMCVKYAQNACVERYGYRLYFALPVSDEPVNINSVSTVVVEVDGLSLPFALPSYLSTKSVATLDTDAAHNLSAGDRVQLAGSANAGLNGEFPVFGVVDATHFQVAFNDGTSLDAGAQMTMQKLATRNNAIAVYNLNNKAWESIDWLPANFYADWLRVCEHAAQRRLVMIDADNGPLLYEDGNSDEVGVVLGGITLPFNLPVQLEASNYATQPIAGRLVTRCFRWGAGSDVWTGSLTNQTALRVNRAEVRATLDTASALTLTLNARTPNYTLWSSSRNFVASQFKTADVPLRKLCGTRALEAQVEIDTTGGRPTIRSIAVETAPVGRVEE